MSKHLSTYGVFNNYYSVAETDKLLAAKDEEIASLSGYKKKWLESENEIHDTQQLLAEAEDLLRTMYYKWENGIPCHEEGEEDEAGVSIGNAFKLSDEEEKEIIAFLNMQQKGTDDGK